MEGKVFCPWCEEKMTPKMRILEKANGKVSERRCANCGKVLAAYLIEEGDFMSRIRKFEN
jgi:hypothetical protein